MGVLQKIHAALALGGARVLSREHEACDLDSAIDGERRASRLESGGLLSYYAADRAQGRPVVIVHGVHVGATAHDVRPIFECVRWRKPVYAIDLPGFGFSARADVDYSPKLYESELVAFLRRIRRAVGGADVVAVGLGAELAARAAVARPDLVRSLTMLAPTGLSRRERRGPLLPKVLLRILESPTAARLLEAAIASRPALAHYYQRNFFGSPERALVDYAESAARLPGARFAAFAWLRGALFASDIDDVYRRLTVPTLILHDQDPRDATEDAIGVFLRGRPNRRAARIFPSGGFPHFEKRAQTMTAMERHWASLEQHPRDRSATPG